ncbi:MAG: extracellular solute-binding protein [Oscillospiraceae bacterium]|nr:extracellular solute-binding protein [Oscillospiraceae bacterium]
MKSLYFKQFIRAISLALTLIFIIGISAACSGKGADNNANDDNAPESKTDENAEAAEEVKLTAPNLPDMNWQGKEITFLVRGPAFQEWESQDIAVEEENAEPVNDAVYKRNAILEDRYNFKIKKTGAGGDIQTQAEKSIKAGSNDYFVTMCNTQETNNMAMKGYLNDLSKIQHLDLTREYWDQNSVYGFTVGGRIFFMTGDLSVMANDATWILMFNKNVLQDLQLENPYDVVRNNKWTIDKMYDMMKGATKDLNGDGVINGLDDQVGLATHDTTYDGIFFGSGMRVSVMDGEGYPQLAMNNEKISTVMEKSIMIMDKALTYNPPANDQLAAALAKPFEEDRTLFYGEVLQCVIRRRNMETPFGVLPFPKLDENQADYAHLVHVTACMVGVPVSMSDEDMDFTGFVLEAMAAESRNWLVPAYYTTALEGKFMRDEESKEMLDIILRTRRYDLGYVSDWGGMFSTYVKTAKKENADFASVWAQCEDKALTRMEKDVDFYKNLP